MNNWRKGTLNSASGVYEKGSSGKPENLYLYSGKTVAIGTDGLNADAHIGVSTEDWPDPGSPVKIATNATNEESHYTAIFTPDAEEADYKITKRTITPSTSARTSIPGRTRRMLPRIPSPPSAANASRPAAA